MYWVPTELGPSGVIRISSWMLGDDPGSVKSSVKIENPVAPIVTN
jgi:hypothetical protein